jgi:glycosyltransferase involved in cell wall biosynthesis
LAREKPDVSLSAIGVSNVKHTLAAALCGRLGRVILSYHAFAISEPQILSRSAYWMAPILSRVTARTVAVSHALRGNLIQRWHVSPKRTITIYNPVLVGSDTSPLPREPGTPRLVLAAGRLVPGKNMLGVIRAFNHIAARLDAHLVIVGEGPDRPALEAEIAALGLHDRVRLPGYVAEPWDLYRQASCFVSASPVESFSMVVAEALAYGLPVVAYDSPGPREVLAHGRYGTLVTPGDEAALGHAIFRALEAPGDEADRRAGGAAFSLQVGLDAYRRLFGEVVAENRRRGLFNRSSQLSIGRPHSLF